MRVQGESRSHDAKFFKEITAAYKAAFVAAAAGVTNSEGKAGQREVHRPHRLLPVPLKETAPVVKRAVAAVTAQGNTPNVRVANGGLDANWMVRHGIPTVTFGAGQNEVHTVEEWINLTEFESAVASPSRWRRRVDERHPKEGPLLTTPDIQTVVGN